MMGRTRSNWPGPATSSSLDTQSPERDARHQHQHHARGELRRAVHPDRFDELRVPGSVGVGRGHPGAAQRGPATGPKIALSAWTMPPAPTRPMVTVTALPYDPAR